MYNICSSSMCSRNSERPRRDIHMNPYMTRMCGHCRMGKVHKKHLLWGRRRSFQARPSTRQLPSIFNQTAQIVFVVLGAVLGSNFATGRRSWVVSVEQSWTAVALYVDGVQNACSLCGRVRVHTTPKHHTRRTCRWMNFSVRNDRSCRMHPIGAVCGSRRS